jgi:Flp pilus assembly protein TadG
MTVLKIIKKRTRNEDGNAVVEFALIVPVLLIMVLGLVDAGRAIGANARLGNGVTAGLRYALSDSYASTEIAAAAMAGSRYADGEATINVLRFCECPDGTSIACSGTCTAGFKRIFVQVDMTRTQATVFSYPIIGDEVTVSRTGSLQVP